MEKLAQTLLKLALEKGAEEAEVYLEKGRELSVAVRQGELETIETALPLGIGLRVFQGQRQGFAHTTDLHDSGVVERALKTLQFTSPDQFFGLPEIQPLPQRQLNIYDPAIAELSPTQALSYALALEKFIYAQDKRICLTEHLSFFAGLSENYLCNSRGLSVYQQGTYCSAAADIIAEANGQKESGDGHQMYRHLCDYDQEFIGQEAVTKALSLLGAENIASGKYLVFLPEAVAIQFVSLLAEAFTADRYQKGKSLFHGQLGQLILPKELCLYDDPLLPSGLNSYYFDGEGLPGRLTPVVRDGVFQELLYDSYTSRKAHASSTGNAGRGYSSLPHVSLSNFYLQFARTEADPLNGRDGLVVNRIMGLHMANPITGDFSLGGSGYLLQNGQPGKGVRNFAIAGNIKTFFNQLLLTGNKVRFSGAVGSPSLVFQDVTIAGE